MTEIVYFITDDSGLVKIGKTKGPAQKRLKDLQTGNPRELRLVGIKDDYSEKHYHDLFSPYRCRSNSEWFNLCGDLAEFLINEYSYISPTNKAILFLDASGVPKNQCVMHSKHGDFVDVSFLSWIDGYESTRKVLDLNDAGDHIMFHSVTDMADSIDKHFNENGITAPFLQ